MNSTPIQYLNYLSCLDLFSLGLTDNVEAFWSLNKSKNQVALVHKSLDPLKLYEDISDIITLPEGVVGADNNQIVRIPAYSIIHLLEALPELWIRRTNNIYEISCGMAGSEFFYQHQNLEEVVYQAIRYMLMKGALDTNKINKSLQFQL